MKISKRYGYIYLTLNLRNKVLNFYIGQKLSSIFIKSYLGSGKKIQRSIKKFGKDNFSVSLICWAADQLELNLLEKKFVREYRTIYGKRRVYNITHGGNGGAGPRSEETKRKIGIASANRKRTAVECAAISRGNKGRIKSEETRKKLSISITEAHKNGAWDEYNKKRRENKVIKIVLTKEELHEKRSRAMKGNTNFKNRKFTPEYSENLKKAWVLRKARGWKATENSRKLQAESLKDAWKSGKFSTRIRRTYAQIAIDNKFAGIN